MQKVWKGVQVVMILWVLEKDVEGHLVAAATMQVHQLVRPATSLHCCFSLKHPSTNHSPLIFLTYSLHSEERDISSGYY